MASYAEPLPFHPRRDDVSIEGTEGVFLQYLKMYNPHARDVLDLGCGRGILTTAGLKEGLNMVAADIRRGIYQADKSRFFQADARKLPFKRGSFDGVIEFLFLEDLRVLQKVPDETIKTVTAEVHRVLRHGGIFVSRPTHMSEIYTGIGFETMYYGADWGIYRKQ